MKIIIPGIANRYNDWTDRELVVLSLFFYFYSLDGNRNTTYYAVSHDIKKILDITHATNPELYIGNLRRAMRIGLLSWDVWSFKLRWDEDTTAANGRLLSCTREIQDVEAIKLFSYIAGRLTAPGIIETSKGLPYVDNKGCRIHPLMGPHFAQSILSND